MVEPSKNVLKRQNREPLDTGAESLPHKAVLMSSINVWAKLLAENTLNVFTYEEKSI